MNIESEVKLIATGQIGLAKIKAGGQITLEMIRDCVRKTIKDSGVEGQIDEKKLVAELERDYHTFVGEALTLHSDDDGWEPWLPKAKGGIQWRFWQRYRTYLLQVQNFPKPVVDKLDEVTDETLGNLISPSDPGSWDRRGMVVGHVQAGKTTNYAGLICKAADAGYKVIIVLTGFHNNLRTQTQIRLEETFVGYDNTTKNSGPLKPIGVGEISSDPSLRVDTITNRSEDGDFNRKVAEHFGMHPGGLPLVFVIKKNASILKNLIGYLESKCRHKDTNGKDHIGDIPLLLIDDEADQGSVDTKKMDFDSEGDPDPDHDPTTLNRQIRKILFIFSQSAYVGYTATPFANIFIHNEAKTDNLGEDLFPRSFITVMPTPSNYIGPEKVFGLTDDDDDDENRQPGLPIVRLIDDYAVSTDFKERIGWMPPKHDRTHVPLYKGNEEVPDSLREAVMAFIISCSVRSLRGQGGKHNSMLIHITRFVDVQEHVYSQVDNLMRDLKQILSYGEEGSADKLLMNFKQLWENDFIPTNVDINDPLCPEHNWAEVSKEILIAVQSIDVRRINGSAGDVLDYETHRNTGLNVIAIGGDKLSRGLTLEGLTVSYFTRPTRMYDTLMQMGRWFGYRDGFIDVCRLYAPESLVRWFEHITDASDELRRDFVLMCEIGETPATYGHKVQSHPALMVTSQVKMRHTTTLTCSFQGAISETIVYSRDNSVVQQNYKACEDLLDKISTYAELHRSQRRFESTEASGGKYMWSGVESDHILNFLRGYKTPKHVRRVNTTLLAKYIEKQVENGDLSDWSVLLAGKDPDSIDPEIIAGCRTGLIERAIHPSPKLQQPDPESPVYRIRRLVSPSDESWDLSKDQYDEAFSLTLRNPNRKSKTGKDPVAPGGQELRVMREKSNALLILYPLESIKDAAPIGETDSCYMGFAISFPGNKNAKPVRYVVGNVYKGQMDD